MRTIFVIIIAVSLSGCFGYRVISKAELEQVKKISYLTGRMESINKAARAEKPAECTIVTRISNEKDNTDSGFIPCGRAGEGGGPF